ncbi:MAG: hypothetical protein E6J10_12340 [Chloroflexi bacterium]|nr:MAG: hypothetical protein E6J10_12340 [Chloroflexota bacterium]
MAKRKKNDQEEEQQPAQQYDTTFKDWLRQAARSVLPLFLPGATYEETLDVEIIKPTMRADKVFIVMYRGKKHILHIEFETGTDPHMKARYARHQPCHDKASYKRVGRTLSRR